MAKKRLWKFCMAQITQEWTTLATPVIWIQSCNFWIVCMSLDRCISKKASSTLPNAKEYLHNASTVKSLKSFGVWTQENTHKNLQKRRSSIKKKLPKSTKKELSHLISNYWSQKIMLSFRAIVNKMRSNTCSLFLINFKNNRNSLELTQRKISTLLLWID